MLVIINFDLYAIKGNSLPDKQDKLLEDIYTTEFKNNNFTLKKL